AGQADAAIADYRTALEFLPDNGPALANLAARLARQGRLQEALPYAKRAVAAAADLIAARVNLARIYAQLGDTDAARREFAAAESIAPNDPAVHQLKAQLYPSSGP